MQLHSIPKTTYRSAPLRRAKNASLRRSLNASAQSKNDQEINQPGKRSTYRPDSYTEIVDDATRAIAAALNAQETRMEVVRVELPELPTLDSFVRSFAHSLTRSFALRASFVLQEFPSVSNVSGYAGSSDLFIDSSIQLSISMARKLHAATGKKVHIVLPDGPEYNRAYKLFKAALESSDGVSLGHLREGKKNTFMASLAVSFSFTGETPPDSFDAGQNADVYVAVNASTVELPELETYSLEVVKDKPLVTWNMELDNLRADLGLLGFPPKALQYRFLSQIKPVFYIRQRDYSKTVSVSPFIINYSGALFREYPGPWQAMLRQDNGTYACVAERPERYALGAFKLELAKAMGLDDEEGSTIQFLRTGRRTATWWEDEEEGGANETSRAWRE